MKKVTAGLLAVMMLLLSVIPAGAADASQEKVRQSADSAVTFAEEADIEAQEDEEEVIYNQLTVCGVRLFKNDNLTGEKIEGVTYDAETSTLTLNNFNGRGDDNEGIYSSGISDLKIELIGDNVLYTNYVEGISFDGRQGSLTIGGEGSLTIQLDGRVGYGIMVGITDSFIMESGELNIVTMQSLGGFYGITKGASFDGEKNPGEFRFLGGTVNIKADEIPKRVQSDGIEYSTVSAGIDAQHSNLTIKDTEVNVELQGGGSVFGVATGLCDKDDNIHGGKLTIDNAVINCKATGNMGYMKTMYFYDMNDLSNSLYYVGRRAANKLVSFDDAFHLGMGIETRYETDYEYITISPEPIEVQMAFDDVRGEEGKKDWYYDYVKYVFDNGIMTGKDDILFAPVENLARAQFAVILHRMNEEPKMEYTNKFPDVKEGLWYTDAILWANSIGVVKGYESNGLFGTADNINREQMAVMMYRYAQYKKYDTSKKADFSKFEDASKVNAFAKEAMEWAVGTEIITGKDNGKKLDPQGNANRAECAAIVMRFMETYKEAE